MSNVFFTILTIAIFAAMIYVCWVVINFMHPMDGRELFRPWRKIKRDQPDD